MQPQLRGELAWIVMKALEKDRDRRYESASALAADVQRYLNDEAVDACPPSAGYRLRRYARRNRRALAMAGFLQGKIQPRDNTQRLHLAQLRTYKKYNRAAAQVYADAFAAVPKRADDLSTQERYNAACCAALKPALTMSRSGTSTESHSARMPPATGESAGWARREQRPGLSGTHGS
jgi:hypothetical protein